MRRVTLPILARQPDQVKTPRVFHVKHPPKTGAGPQSAILRSLGRPRREHCTILSVSSSERPLGADYSARWILRKWIRQASRSTPAAETILADGHAHADQARVSSWIHQRPSARFVAWDLAALRVRPLQLTALGAASSNGQHVCCLINGIPYNSFLETMATGGCRQCTLASVSLAMERGHVDMNRRATWYHSGRHIWGAHDFT
jgi:hypothetical protein